jgi:hypothetical protein
VVPTKVEVVPDVLAALRSSPMVRLVAYDAKAPETYNAVRRSVRRMLQMPDGGAGYLRWRLRGAPAAVVAMFKAELAAQQTTP